MNIAKVLRAILSVVALAGTGIALVSARRVAAQPAEPPPFLWPLSGSAVPDVISSPFGPRPRPVTVYEFHEGIDLPAPEGTPVFAASTATVHRLTDDAGCRIEIANDTAPPGCTPIFPRGGRIVALAHGNELYTLYLHLSRQADELVTGARVLAGAKIGEVGKTGNASYFHLHFEVRDGSFFQIDRPAKNALGYLQRTRIDAPVVTDLSLTPAGDGTGDVAVVVETPPDDLDLNEVRLITRDVGGTVVDDRRVRLNERENISPDVQQPEVFFDDGSSIFLDPTCLALEPSCGDPKPVYRLTVLFKRFPVPPQGSYEALAIDVSGLMGRRVLEIN
ncbi:MAG TPA: M23 family metallopeptidase [Candidatus Dormibacteraeota bacterium]|nr:M23 family metallopeptidase [Candidatus Dormibacteraeota bacterium]